MAAAYDVRHVVDRVYALTSDSVYGQRPSFMRPSLFHIVKFPNDECLDSSNQSGTCYTPLECKGNYVDHFIREYHSVAISVRRPRNVKLRQGLWSVLHHLSLVSQCDGTESGLLQEPELSIRRQPAELLRSGCRNQRPECVPTATRLFGFPAGQVRGNKTVTAMTTTSIAALSGESALATG